MSCCSGKKVIVVFGATGSQGGSVARALKGDDKFHVKAVTRNPDSDKAKALHAQGVEVVKVELDDAAGVKKALEGAYGVFLVTNYWEMFDMKREIQQAKNVVDAAKANNIQHLVFSSLNSTVALVGKNAAHMESKVETVKYIVQQGVPHTVVRMAFYFENLLGMLKPYQNEQGEYVLNIPMGDKLLDMVCIAEVGECVHQFFVKPDEFKGKDIGLSAQSATVTAYAGILSKILTPKKFVASAISTDAYGKLGFPGADDLAIMFEAYQTGKCDFNVELTRRLHPNMPTFEQWVEKNKAAFQAAFQ